MFEPHTECITKGKVNDKVEFGHAILITTIQHQFIVNYKVMGYKKGASQVEPLTERLAKRFVNTASESHRFDKGFLAKNTRH